MSNLENLTELGSTMAQTRIPCRNTRGDPILQSHAGLEGEASLFEENGHSRNGRHPYGFSMYASPSSSHIPQLHYGHHWNCRLRIPAWPGGGGDTLPGKVTLLLALEAIDLFAVRSLLLGPPKTNLTK